MLRRVGRRKAKQVVTMEMQVKNLASMPEDITWEILSKLPIEMIIRSRGVCKRWNELTRSDGFIKFHLRETNSKPPWLILQSQRKAEMNTLCLFDAQEFKVKNILLQRELCDLKIQCSCDGLLCLAREFDIDPVYICNPMTEEYVRLPSSQCKEKLARCCLGIGFDASSRKYKVIRFYKTIYSNKNHFEILTFGESSWRQLCAAQDTFFSDFGAAVEWDGSLHWLIYNTNYPIIAFDLSKEEFYRIPYPFGIRSFGIDYDLVLLREYVAVVEKCPDKVLRIWKVIGNKVEGFSLSMADKYNTHRSRNFRCNPLLQLNDGSLLLNVREFYQSRSRRVAKRDLLESFETKTGKHLKQKIKDLPSIFTALQFRPTLNTPVAGNYSSSSNIHIPECQEFLSGAFVFSSEELFCLGEEQQ